MVIDTSAVVAFLRDEPEAERVELLLDATDGCRMSAYNALECRTLLWRRFGAAAVGEFELFLSAARVVLDDFDADQAMLASEAYQRYGKGSGHPARLNLGDCAAYALATSHRLPLLFKGEDFVHPDVTACL